MDLGELLYKLQSSIMVFEKSKLSNANTFFTNQWYYSNNYLDSY
jgi:hypothetical protein